MVPIAAGVAAKNRRSFASKDFLGTAAVCIAATAAVFTQNEYALRALDFLPLAIVIYNSIGLNARGFAGGLAGVLAGAILGACDVPVFEQAEANFNEFLPK